MLFLQIVAICGNTLTVCQHFLGQLLVVRSLCSICLLLQFFLSFSLSLFPVFFLLALFLLTCLAFCLRLIMCDGRGVGACFLGSFLTLLHDLLHLLRLFLITVQDFLLLADAFVIVLDQLLVVLNLFLLCGIHILDELPVFVIHGIAHIPVGMFECRILGAPQLLQLLLGIPAVPLTVLKGVLMSHAALLKLHHLVEGGLCPCGLQQVASVVIEGRGVAVDQAVLRCQLTVVFRTDALDLVEGLLPFLIALFVVFKRLS